MEPHLTIGEVARRSGVAPSGLRYYESLGLIASERTSGNQRRYRRSVLRRVAFIRTASRVGLTLTQIRDALATLPDRRTPTAQDWTRLSASWRPLLDARIAELERLRDDLDSCIGCGCLSLERCALQNPGDRAAALGPGPRYLEGDTPADAARAEARGGGADAAARP
ncbi:redox-sensitive transcriptional activator SoxR [Isoptericola variabilis]|uniref:Transcriptional regulator, MerR family n=1 Tax=Isoptericola variabilis (strain 225) TaxID=743718 RepID=F6FSA9_ISOV2|nr:redox-sensitive transcriptional activator SoxR [Isoptericola variabilis]AEG43050.1 transcriptional regulator, MerR family [Isoptericola variabilis 225]TWH29981.1 MerR family redox-sensitive transcriptional activator SoxR [Isoptericola variabilis J7]